MSVDGLPPGQYAETIGRKFLEQFGGGAVIWFEWGAKKPHSFAIIEGATDADLPLICGALLNNLSRIMDVYAKKSGLPRAVFDDRVYQAAAAWEKQGSPHMHQWVVWDESKKGGT